MNNSNLAMAVLNNVATKTLSASGDFPAEQSQTYKVYSSGFVALAGDTEGKNFEVKTVTSNITGVAGWIGQSGQYTIPNTTIPNDNTYYPSIPYIGDPIPFIPGGIPNNPPPFAPVFPQTGQIKIVPDLEQLEEGVHDIKGGKVIIKKIKVTEEQIEEALEEELGHKPTDEEKQKLHEDLEALSASEEREV